MSVGCHPNIILLTFLIFLKHRPRSMSDCCETRLIYAAMDSCQSRHCKLSAKINERERKWMGLGQLFHRLHADGGLNIQQHKINTTDESIHSHLTILSMDTIEWVKSCFLCYMVAWSPSRLQLRVTKHPDGETIAQSKDNGSFKRHVIVSQIIFKFIYANGEATRWFCSAMLADVIRKKKNYEWIWNAMKGFFHILRNALGR